MPPFDHGETIAPNSARIVRPTGGWADLMSMSARRRTAALDLVDDLIILAQFAFGRDYGHRPSA